VFKEFRDFAIKGNMVDLAIGVIIGAAFGAIVSSLVDDVFMPIIGLIIGGIDFSNLFVVLNNPAKAVVNSLAAAKAAGVSTLNIGLFINAIVKFFIIALVLFFVVKGINSLKRKQVPEAPAAPSATETLLGQIRDALLARPKAAPVAIAAPLAAALPLTSTPASDTARPTYGVMATAAANPPAGSTRPASATTRRVSSSTAAARLASGGTPAAASSGSTPSATPASAMPPASSASSTSSAATAPGSTPKARQRGGAATTASTAGAGDGTSPAAATSAKAKGEDWAVDVLKYSPAANAKAIAGVVRYCGIALRNRDSSLVAFSDKTEVTYVREHFLKKKLALTLPDSELDSALDAVGERMKADRTKNRVTVYYLLAEHFGMLSMFG
jgi:large conductance mechanosensitive channel